MKQTLLLLAAFFFLSFTQADKIIYQTNTADINFFSSTVVEDISADNHKVKTAFDAVSGKLQFSVLIKDFEFEKALMQKHFNDDYMESDVFPKATFRGTIADMATLKLNEDGTYTSAINGTLKIKDVSKEISTTATFIVKSGAVNAKAKFIINPADYNVKIPKVVSKKIAEEIAISIDADYLKK